MGSIDLDPCSNEHSVVGAEYSYDLSKGQDGLELPWTPYRGNVFVNPPYSREANKAWAEKALTEFHFGSHMYLVPASFGAKWFDYYLQSSTVALLGRVRFLGAPWKSDFDLALVLRTVDDEVEARFRELPYTRVRKCYV